MEMNGRVYMILSWLVCAISVAMSQTTTAPVATASSQIGWVESWRLATLSFGIVDKNTEGKEFYRVIGTGVLFALNSKTGYIVTAKHVFYEPEKNWHPAELRIRFGWQDKESVYEGLGASVVLRDDAGNDLWKSLPDGSDVATIKAPPPTQLNQPAVTTSVIAKEDDFFEGANVIVLGYPGIVGNEYLVKAINRGGVVAWLNPKDAYESPFLIDANVYPGNSGGPVIKVPSGYNKQGTLVLGGQAVLLGIVSQAPGQVQDLELRVPGNFLPLKIHQEIPVGGTGVVVPATKVLQLLKTVQAN